MNQQHTLLSYISNSVLLEYIASIGFAFVMLARPSVSTMYRSTFLLTDSKQTPIAPERYGLLCQNAIKHAAFTLPVTKLRIGARPVLTLSSAQENASLQVLLETVKALRLLQPQDW